MSIAALFFMAQTSPDPNTPANQYSLNIIPLNTIATDSSNLKSMIRLV